MSLQRAANFDGANYLVASNYTGNPAAFSVALFALPASGVVSEVFFGNVPGWVVGIDDAVSTTLKFYLGGANLSSTGAFSVGAWHQFVFTYDGTTARIYIDGNTTPNASAADAITYGSVPPSNWIGSLSSGGQLYQGLLAGVGYYSRALSGAEVASLYNSGAGLTFADLSGSLLTGLVSYQDFTNTGALGTDQSGNGHAFTNTGAVTPAFGPGHVYVPYTLVQDNLAGTTTATIVGHLPDKPNLTDTWAAGFGEGAMVFAVGGGVTSSGAGSSFSCDLPMTGLVGGVARYSTTWEAKTGFAGAPAIYMRARFDGSAFVLLQGNYSNNTLTLFVIVGGSAVIDESVSLSLVTGTTYTIAVDLGETTITASVDGTPLFNAFPIPAGSDPAFGFQQMGGAAGDVTFGPLAITVAGPQTASVTGPTAITEGMASANYTITLDSPVPPGGAGLTFTPSSTVFTSAPTPSTRTIAPGASTGTFTVDATSAGTGIVTVAETAGGSGITITPQSGVTSSAYSATVAVTGPGSLVVGTPGTFTYTLSVPAPSAGVTITPSTTVFSSTFGTGTISIGTGQTVGTDTVTATTAGSGTVTGSGTGLTFTPKSVNSTSGSATAYTLTVSSPSSGFVANASANFTLQANGTPSTTLVVTPSDGAGGLFSPSTASITDSLAHTFTYTPSSAGSKTVAVTHTGGSGISGDPASVSYTANARALAVSPTSVVTSGSGTLTFTGGGTKWTSSAPTFGPTGVSGFTLGSVTVVNDTSCTAGYTTSTTTGTETFTDSTTSATTTLSVAAPATHNQLQAYYPAASLATEYFIITSPGKAWDGSAFESFNSSHWAGEYAIAGTDPGGVRIYSADFPAAIPDGVYTAYAYLQLGGSPAPTDTLIGSETGSWDGSTFGPGSGGSGGGGGGVTLDELDAALASALAPFDLHLFKATTSTSVTLADADASDAADALANGQPQWVTIGTGLGVFQSRQLLALVSGQTYTVLPWTQTPDTTTSGYWLHAPEGTAVNLQVGTVLASPVPTTSSFSATGLSFPTRGGAGMRVLFQGLALDGVARRVATCLLASTNPNVYAITLEFDANNLFSAPPATGQQFLMG